MRGRFIGHLLPGWAGPEGQIQVLPGLVFVYGEWREVPDDVARELAGHAHLEFAEGDIPPESEPITDWRALDKAALDAYAAGLGIKLDRRKSLERMQEAFEMAVFSRKLAVKPDARG